MISHTGNYPKNCTVIRENRKTFFLFENLQISAFFGLISATIGFDPIAGFPRFTFGRPELPEGPAFIPAMIGPFAVSEILKSVEKTGKFDPIKAKITRSLPSAAECV